MKGQPELAIADAQRTIDCLSTSAEGYLRKANILTMYGKQAQAIEAYKEGLRNTETEKERQISIQQMEKGLTESIKQNEIRVDFISKLPIDVVKDAIIPLFAPSANATCLAVSKVWRKIFVDCPGIWESLLAADDDQNTIRLFNMIPSAGRYVKYLTINTHVSAVHTACFRFMKNGHLSRIESFKMKKGTTKWSNNISFLRKKKFRNYVVFIYIFLQHSMNMNNKRHTLLWWLLDFGR